MKKMNFVAASLVVRGVAFSMLGLLASQVSAQTAPMFRCNGNTYTNMPSDMVGKNCKPVEGNVTTVHGTKVFAAEPVRVASVTPKTTSTSSSSGQRSEQRNDSAEQKGRDSDSRSILESELKKSESKLTELLKEYNNGEPDRNALDIKNPQRYVDRLAEMKANIARLNSDIEGIKRELGRKS